MGLTHKNEAGLCLHYPTLGPAGKFRPARIARSGGDVFQIIGAKFDLSSRSYLNVRRFPIMLQVARNTRINDILGGIVSSRTRPASISSSEAASRAIIRIISLGVTVPESMHARGVLRDEGLARNQGGLKSLGANRTESALESREAEPMGSGPGSWRSRSSGTTRRTVCDGC